MSRFQKMSRADRLRRRAVLIRRHGEKCAECGALGPREGGTANITLDHIIPRGRGGSHRLDNLQLLCGPCNCAKGDTMQVAA